MPDTKKNKIFDEKFLGKNKITGYFKIKKKALKKKIEF